MVRNVFVILALSMASRSGLYSSLGNSIDLGWESVVALRIFRTGSLVPFLLQMLHAGGARPIYATVRLLHVLYPFLSDI